MTKPAFAFKAPCVLLVLSDGFLDRSARCQRRWNTVHDFVRRGRDGLLSDAEGNQFPDHLNFAVTHGDGSVLEWLDYTPPPWTGASVNPLTPGAFTNRGDGSGAVGLTISAPTGYDGHFGGAIDDLSVAGAVPEPASWALMIGGFGVIGAAARRRWTVLA